MNATPIAEFAQYRFLRDSGGGVVTLPSQGSDEKCLLVLDCDRWALARLHIFEGAAVRGEKLAAFEEEMRRVSACRDERIARILTWGRDGEELFYADAMRDGEPLPTYLGRTGGVPLPIACGWVLGFLDLFAPGSAAFGSGPLPASVDQLTTMNFEVVRSRDGSARLVFSEFRGWTKPGGHVREHRLEWSLAQVFCSLVAGVPIRTFHRDSLPRNFDTLPPRIQEVVLTALDESHDSLAGFREGMRAGAAAEESGGSAIAAAPKRPLRDWLDHELQTAAPGQADRSLPATPEPYDEAYAIATHLRGGATNLQVLPGPSSIPREGWLNQHHDATRRPGRGRIHQLQVNYIEDLGPVTLVGEERVEGVDLDALVERSGPMDWPLVRRVAGRLQRALDALESQPGAGAVWWLPAENIFFLSGTRSLEASVALIGRKGPVAWEEFPLKFRLHQTVESLKRAVGLPAAVRELTRLPGRQHEAARRSAIALPLLWQLFTGTRFRWDEPVTTASLPGTLGGLFERTRLALVEDPTGLEDGLFPQFLAMEPVLEDSGPAEPVKPSTEPGDEGEAGDASPVPDPFDEVEALLSGQLYLGDLGLESPEPVRVEAGSAVETIPMPEDLPRRSPAALWVGITLAAIVAAAGTGFALSGWSARLGLFRSASGLSFTLPEFRAAPVTLDEVAKPALSELLLAEGSPQSLRLLPMMKRIDLESVTREVEPWLRHLHARGNDQAARVMGLLSLALSQPDGTAAGWFLEAARKGDAESAYRYAALLWDPAAKSVTDSEALRLLESAAEAGHAGAQQLFSLTKAQAGDGEAAYRWMRQAAEQGWRPAVYELGILLAGGTGTKVDRAGAADHFRRAAEQGDERAMYDYGRCLAEGFGMPANFTEAVRWVRLASAAGHGGALRWLLDRGLETGAGPAQE